MEQPILNKRNKDLAEKIKRTNKEKEIIINPETKTENQEEKTIQNSEEIKEPEKELTWFQKRTLKATLKKLSKELDKRKKSWLKEDLNQGLELTKAIEDLVSKGYFTLEDHEGNELENNKERINFLQTLTIEEKMKMIDEMLEELRTSI